jgi:ABC-type multidrug transport system ATPase subunit
MLRRGLEEPAGGAGAVFAGSRGNVALDTPPSVEPGLVAGDEGGVDLHDRTRLRIGRAVDNDLSLDDLRVSRHHAEIVAMPDGAWELHDLQSSNGTYLNGRRVRSERLEKGDFIGVGGQTLQVLDGRLRIVSARHTAWFGAVDLVVNAGGRRILDEVGFALEPSSLLAVVGTSGSGKSTLLNALTGFKPADSGNVVFDGRDVYATYEDIRLRMGLVPQSDILHTQLTVRQALSYAAELRFPRDVPAARRRERVDEVMAELNLTERADVRIDRLSGGQRKRVSVGCELLTEPDLLFLDEPTSGLDPGNEAALMESLRDLARAGRTVVVVTHSTQSLHLCDRLLVLAPGGKLAYYGAPSQAGAYFAKFGVGEGAGYAGIFQALEASRDVDWKARFRADPAFEKLVREPLASADLVPVPVRPNIDPPPPTTPVMHQLGVLVRRYIAVIRADRGFVLALALQAPIFGLLISLLYTKNILKPSDSLNASVLIWLIVLGATWLGTSNAIREIVKELPIYRRERAIGLSAGAYVTSKVAVLGVITALQAAVLVPIALRGQHLPIKDDVSRVDMQALLARFGLDPGLGDVTFVRQGNVFLDSQLTELIVVVVVTGIASLALGLLISAVSGGADRAASLLPIVLVAQVIVSAPLMSTTSLPIRLAGYVFSAQWGMSAAASTIELNELRRNYLAVTQLYKDQSEDDATAEPPTAADLEAFDPKAFDKPTWRHDQSVWAADMALLVALTVVGLAGAWIALRATDPDLMEGRHSSRRKRGLLSQIWPRPQSQPVPIR